MRNDYCSNYLEHIDKGGVWKNHKYVAKFKLPNGKYFYFYDLATYQNYLKRRGQGVVDKVSDFLGIKKNKDKKVQTEKEQKQSTDKQQKKATTAEQLAAKKTEGKTKEEKTKNMEENIDKGKKAIDSLLNTASSKKSKSGSSSGKSSSGSSKKKSSGSKGKSSSGSSKKKTSAKKEKENKEKQQKTSTGSTKQASSSKASSGSSGSTKQATSTAKQTTSAKATADSTKQSTANKTKSSGASLKTSGSKSSDTQQSYVDTIKKMYNISNNDVSNYLAKDGQKISKEEATMIESAMESKYKDGATGFIITDNDTAYRWTKVDGKIEVVDAKTNQKVTLNDVLLNTSRYTEFAKSKGNEDDKTKKKK